MSDRKKRINAKIDKGLKSKSRAIRGLNKIRAATQGRKLKFNIPGFNYYKPGKQET